MCVPPPPSKHQTPNKWKRPNPREWNCTGVKISFWQTLPSSQWLLSREIGLNPGLFVYYLLRHAKTQTFYQELHDQTSVRMCEVCVCVCGD